TVHLISKRLNLIEHKGRSQVGTPKVEHRHLVYWCHMHGSKCQKHFAAKRHRMLNSAEIECLYVMSDPTKHELTTIVKQLRSSLRHSKRAATFFSKKAENPTLPWQVFRLPRVAAILDVHPRTILRWIDDLNFPKPVKLGKAAIAWRADEVEAWVKDRP